MNIKKEMRKTENFKSLQESLKLPKDTNITTTTKKVHQVDINARRKGNESQ